MHCEMGDMMRQRLAFGAGLPRNGLVGKDNVAKMRRFVGRLVGCGRKRQHIGGRVDAAPQTVELADRRIIGQHDSKLGPAC